MRLRSALAAALLLAVAPQCVLAQSYEDRGYGGPLSVGPNFKQGGQHSTTDYGAKPPKKPAAKPYAPAKHPAKVAKPPKPTVKKKDDVARTPATATPVASETAAPPETAVSDTPAAETPATCRRFVATTSTTIEVKCE